MPSLSISLPDLRQSGPLLEVLFTVSKPVQDLLKGSNQPLPEPMSCTALIDTGASTTAMRKGIAQNLNLQPRGVVDIATPSCEKYQCNTFDVSIIFPGHGVSIPLVTVTEAPLTGQHIDCLIGRDLLMHGILIYEGYSNRFVLSF